MNYNLNSLNSSAEKKTVLKSLRTLISHMVEEKKLLLIAFIAMLITALLSLLGPILIGYTIDHYIQSKQRSAIADEELPNYHGRLNDGVQRRNNKIFLPFEPPFTAFTETTCLL